ncbi:MAG: hypothetical protein Q9191_006784 [Dirinaria sp. TL-2023a]
MSNHLRGSRSISSQSGQPLNAQNPQNISASGNYSDDILRQSEEQQSIYRDPGASGINEYEVEEYNISNPRKRVHTDGPENPKKRAAVACNVCRGQCIYQEPGIKLDAGDRMILERLDRIEGFLQSGWSGQPSATGSVNIPPQRATTAIAGNGGMPEDRFGAPQNGGLAARTAVMLPPARPEDPLPLMRPIFDWPKVQDLIAQPYDQHTLLQLELEKESLELDASLSLEYKNNPTLVQAYFDNVNTWYACVDPYDWSRIYEKASISEYREGAESCLVLLVLALGAVSYSRNISNSVANAEPLGMPFFSAAWGLLSTLTVSHDVIASQCTILASVYFCYLARPLEAWTLLSSTIPKLQVLISKAAATPLRHELSSRVYWDALLLESSLLASLDLPSSQLSELSTMVPLPAPFAPSNGTPPSHQDDPWLLSALISFDRLSYKISHQTTLPDATHGQIASSLNAQLTEWYTAIPFHSTSVVPPPRADLQHPALEYLRTLYFLGRMRIFRPYISSVLTDESIPISPLSICRDSCRACIDSALRFAEDLPACLAIAPWLKWQTSLAAVEAALLLMGASRSPNLSLLIESSAQVDSALNGAIRELDGLSPQAPSLARAFQVLKEAEGRRKGLR